ncbi:MULTISPECIES: hypothetical protein [unclassified Mesorhizobium]|uniref:hypothetical protein n=1 Tax=unclassified Mesorhizobium TaxID=325217 RepID=UPI0015E2ACC4|nr:MULTISPECIES: hypothetical protein [unclassified Mesorhizobium]
MAHEETADLLRSARPKILQNSIFHQDKETEIEFCKNFGRVLPRQGLAAKAGGRLYERHKREWFGATEGRENIMAARAGAADIGRASERSTTMPIDTLHRPLPAASSA